MARRLPFVPDGRLSGKRARRQLWGNCPFMQIMQHISQKLESKIQFFGVIIMLEGALADLVRTYTIKIGDLGKFSRYGVCVFAICIVICSVIKMMREHVKFVEQAKNDALAASVAKSQFL